MATFEITTPDGRKFEIEGETQEGALAALQAHLGVGAKSAPKQDEIGNTGGLSANATQGALFGFGDEYMSGLSAILGVQPDGEGGADWFNYEKPIGERYDTALRQIRTELGQYSDENPKKALAAQIVGGATTAVGTAIKAPIAIAKTAMGRTGQVAGGGAIAGTVEGFGSGEGGVGNRLKSAAIGGGVGAVAAPLVGIGFSKIVKAADQIGGKALRSVFQNKRMYNRGSGTLTEKGKVAVAALGVDPDRVSSEMATSLGLAAEKAVDGGITDPNAVKRMASGERFAVPLTRGQATGDVIQAASEESFRAGSRGRGAMQTMEAFDTVQREAVDTAREGVGGALAVNAIDRVDAADAVIDGVRREADTARQSGKAAYDAVAAANGGIKGNTFNSLNMQIKNAVSSEGFALDAGTTNANAALGVLRSSFEGAKTGVVPFQNVERTRQRLLALNKAARSGSNGADQVATQAVLREYDKFLDDSISDALIQGDDVMPLIKEARGQWARYRQTFLSKEGADNFIRKIVEDDLSPDQVSGWLFGAANTPGGGQTSLVASRVKNILGETSPEWQSVKRAAWEHITKAPEGKDMGPQRIASNISELLNGKGKSLSGVLFTEKERVAMGEFRDLMKVLVPPKKATNPSGTGYQIERSTAEMFRMFAGMMGGAAAGPVAGIATREAVGQGSEFSSKMLAKAAARGIVQAPASNAVAIGAGVTAGAAAQNETIR